jgi:hypothetical protein
MPACISPVTFMHRKDQEVSYGLNWAIAGKGVVVKDKVYHNLETSKLQKVSATSIGMYKFLPSSYAVHIYINDVILNMQKQ